MDRNQITVEMPCEKVIDRVAHEMKAAGFRVTRSFDLQSARQALIHPEACACPFHGTAQCACQYVILLIQSEKPQPYSLIIHGHEQQTHVTLADSNGDPSFDETPIRIQSMMESLFVV